MSFDDDRLPFALRKSARMWGYVKPTTIQRHAMPVGIARRDMLAYAPPVSGKTAALCVPVVIQAIAWTEQRGLVDRQAPIAAMIASSPRACTKMFDELNKFIANTGVRAVLACSEETFAAQGFEIIVSTPARLANLAKDRRVNLCMVRIAR
jgi:superfamily II DNA/RNA helicase